MIQGSNHGQHRAPLDFTNIIGLLFEKSTEVKEGKVDKFGYIQDFFTILLTEGVHRIGTCTKTCRGNKLK